METDSNYDEKPTVTNMSVELCLVCGDRASGRHYGAISCEGCKGFFKRSIRKQLGYQCRGTMNCEVTKHHRNRCQFCRLQKCLASGMRSDSVQHERKPIVEKKEIQMISNNLNSSSGTSTSSASLYNYRNKTKTENCLNVQGPVSSNLNVFSVGFNFADLSQTLSKRALITTPFQQQQQQQENFKCAVGTQINDDDSVNNNLTNSLPMPSHNLMTGSSVYCGNRNDSTTPLSETTAAAAANIIQTSFEKNLLTQSLNLISIVQQQYENTNNDDAINVNNDDFLNNNSNNIVNNNSENYISNNCINIQNINYEDSNNIRNNSNIISTNSSVDALTTKNNDNNDINNDNNNNDNNNYCSNIVKKELIIDEFSIIERDLTIEDDRNSKEKNKILDECILPKTNISFNLQSPGPVPSYLNIHYVCECGSRLLFLSVYWIKKIPAFQQLSEEIQINLLRYHWVELFTIGLAQSSRNLSTSTIMTTLATNIMHLSEIEKISAIRIQKMSEHTYQLNEFIQSMQALQLDEYEYAYIRLIIIFNTVGLYIKDTIKRNNIEKLQEKAINSLKNYYNEKQNSNTSLSTSSSSDDNFNERPIKILLRLMQLKSLESEIIEELFFSNLIGQVQIETMIPYILKLGGGGI